MTKEEKYLKNRVLDFLEYCLNLTTRFNNGDMISFEEGSLKNEIKLIQETIYRLRDATITEDK
jgi:hypothetical protein